MTWRELPPLATDVADQLPEMPDVRLVASRIVDHRQALWDAERPAVARAAERRALEFSTGRHLARCAMADLGARPTAVPRAEDRSPVWPRALVGSITHAGEVAVAATAYRATLAGIGIDLERTGRVTPALYRKLFTAAEQHALEGADARLAALMFSAKEAAYKAVNPQVGRFIGFLEAAVDVSWTDRTLRLHYLGEHEPNRIMDHGTGHFCFFEDYVLTVFAIPRR